MTSGANVPVMHACGHDVHMATWIGTATILAQVEGSAGQGTLMFIGQPAEETHRGREDDARGGSLPEVSPSPMSRSRFTITTTHRRAPSACVPGYVMANADAVDITIYGRGGHGAYPQTTVDPIVIAARTVVALQTVVARENDPLDPAVVTVGSIHGGTQAQHHSRRGEAAAHGALLQARGAQAG